MKLNLRKGIFLTILTLSILTLFKLSPTLLALTVKDSGSSGPGSPGSIPSNSNNPSNSEYHAHSYVKNNWSPLALPSIWHNTNNYAGAPKSYLGHPTNKESHTKYNMTPTPSGTIFRENPHHYQSSGGLRSGHEAPFHTSVSAESLSSSSSSQLSSSPEVESYNNKKSKSPREPIRDSNDLDEIFQNDVEDISKLLRSTSSSAAKAALTLNHFKRSPPVPSYPNPNHHIEYPNSHTGSEEEDSNFRRSNDITKRTRSYDVPQIECPLAEDGMERFSCPTPDNSGRYRCVDDHVLCDGFYDCPNGEDEDRRSCLFYKTTKAHLDVLADALLRWARGRR